MPETMVLCRECDVERQRIEEGGDGKVVSCKPLPGEEEKPQDKRKCRLIWEDNPL